MVDGQDLIRKQMEIAKKEVVVFDNGRKTILNPVKFVPMLEGFNSISLNGTWKVAYWPFDKKEEVMASPGTCDSGWEDAEQPGKIFYSDPEGESKLIKGWDRVTLAHIDEDDGAIIRYTVKTPAAWNNKKILLRFDSIFPAGRVYINGELLGEHLSGLTPVEFDVTEKITYGKDVLVAVRIIRKHKFVQMDMVRHSLEFAGLAQPAYLHAVEPLHIEDYHLVTTINKTLKKGVIEGDITLCNLQDKKINANIAVQVFSPEGKKIKESKKRLKMGAGENKKIDVKIEIDKPLLWNDEYPNLYTVRILLSSPSQQKQEISYRTGFRRLDLSPDGPKLNNNFIKFRGVNHLTYHPDYGMHTPEDWLRKNLEMMKKANVNAIRTHFLGPRTLGRLCDEMGIYLLQELPIDWGTNYIHDPEWVGPAMMRLHAGVLRDRHTTSLMVWSVGNENMPLTAEVAPDGWNHLQIYDRFVKTLDPSRHTMFPPPGPANKIDGIFELRVGDIADTHYSFRHAKNFFKNGNIDNPNSWEADMINTTRQEALNRGWSGVWFSSEYGLFNMIPEILNGPYLSVIADRSEDILSGKNSLQAFIERLDEEWGFMRREETCLGGAYFPWICCGSGDNPWGWTRWGEDHDWGVMCADLTPKPFFWALRALFSPVWLPERMVWKKGDKDIRFMIQNQYNSINLKDCTFRTQFCGGRMSGARRFADVKIFCRPGEKKEVGIPVWDEKILETLDKGAPAACRCTILNPEGFRILTHDIILIPEKLSKTIDKTLKIGPDATM